MAKTIYTVFGKQTVPDWAMSEIQDELDELEDLRKDIRMEMQSIAEQLHTTKEYLRHPATRQAAGNLLYYIQKEEAAHNALLRKLNMTWITSNNSQSVL